MRRALPRVCLSLAVAATACQAGQVTIGTQHFTLPEGYELELVAGPPLVERPISAAFDEQGRLYVSDSSGSNVNLEEQQKNPAHRIVRLEDTDGDGKFDRTAVFADHLTFPEGVLWLEGSLYVGAPPTIWKLTDTDGDGFADQREEWYKGGTLTHCGNDLHGPYLGPEGWIYWCKGAFAEQTHARPDGTPQKDRASHLFRCRPDGSGLESVMTGGMDNPVGLCFTREGEPILSATFLDLSGPGKRDGLAHAVYGGVFGKVNDVLEDRALIRTGPLLPAMTHFGAGAPCGLLRAESALWHDDLFCCLFNLHKVTRHRLVAAGSTYRTQDSDFLVSDSTDFHPTDILEDADGSLVVVDTGGWYKLCCPTSQLAKPDVLGAIYRVRKTGAPKVEDARGTKIAWETLSPDELAALLPDRRPAVVARATALLATRGAEAARAVLGQMFHESPQVRERALWALSRIPGEWLRDELPAAFIDNSPLVQQTAAKIAALSRDAAFVSAEISQVDRVDPAVRRALIEAAGRSGQRGAAPRLLAVTPADASDVFMAHARVLALIELGNVEAARAVLAVDRGPAVKRLALLALGEMNEAALHPGDVLPLLSSKDAGLRETAAWVATRHPTWAGELTTFFRERLGEAAAGNSGEIGTLFSSMLREPAIQQIATAVLQGGDEPACQTVIQAIRDASLKTPPPEWTPLLLKLASTTTSPDLRLAALSAIPGAGLILEAGLLAELRQTLDSRAVSILSRAKLDEAQVESLIDDLPRLGPLEISRLLPVFKRPLPGAAGHRLVAALTRAPARASCPVALLREVLSKQPAAVQAEGETLLAGAAQTTAEQRGKLDTIAAELPPADVRRGQAVFNGRAGCTVCHAIGYLGGKFGPDLTTIGQVRSERDLLEAIVFPSASFVRSYEPVTARLKNGSDVTGLLRSETDDSLLFATAPGAEMRIARADVASVTPGTVSMMPQGFDQILSRQELADLIAFLKAAQRKPN